AGFSYALEPYRACQQVVMEFQKIEPFRVVPRQRFRPSSAGLGLFTKVRSVHECSPIDKLRSQGGYFALGTRRNCDTTSLPAALVRRGAGIVGLAQRGAALAARVASEEEVAQRCRN